jgi:hypothetical protein
VERQRIARQREQRWAGGIARQPLAAPRRLGSVRIHRARVVMSRCLASMVLMAVVVTAATAKEPIRLHPDNPHYFLFRGRPTILITATEHYGAVLNLDFDYVQYLDVLKSHGFNLTRVFAGTYREVKGSFNIKGNTLAPAKGKFVCPWPRSATSGASDGLAKFDLSRWDEAYFRRLKDFASEAGKRGIIVELVLFCTMYDEAVWQASPMNARNNVQGVGAVGKYEVFSGSDKKLLEVQQAVTRKLVSELASFDNVYFEICNEPYERGGLSTKWNDAIIAAIQKAHESSPRKHLIAQGFPHSAKAAADVNPAVSVLNFHAARADDVRLNYSLGKVIGFDETGGSDQSDRKYRTEGWDFIIAGGGVYDHLDFSFTNDHEDGMAVPLPSGTPGGGGPKLRDQLAILKKFVEGFDFVRMRPHDECIERSTIHPGTEKKPTARVLADPGKAYAVYVNGGQQAEIAIKLPAGRYAFDWVNTNNGKVDRSDTFRHEGGTKALSSPDYSEDIALRLIRRG